ncbi:fibronectin type III domain-containing protein [Marinobacter sp. SS21]|uniref:fibronectin type III domain-containing protein n=1 Tax=Marinobacter sp. SS21 TaxID=2979460 RepID=UPI00232CFECC|nr:fibronectin type III domain-containing protein [Marinobacter sp. SS21]MDC0663974.1 fibronectin type III domain-containing protein [Marinobacter sp. SS21]
MRFPRLARPIVRTMASASLASLLFVAGCQDESGTTARSPDAATAAAQREGKVLNTFKRTFESPLANPTPAPGSREVAEAPRPTLEWTAPLTRENGSALYLSEIQGYRLYYRFRHTQAFQWIDVDGADNTRYPLADFESGAYDFAITARDNSGLESRKSEVIKVDLI